MRLMSRLDDERKSGAILDCHFPAIALNPSHTPAISSTVHRQTGLEHDRASAFFGIMPPIGVETPALPESPSGPSATRSRK
jgi:hypothetical protein